MRVIEATLTATSADGTVRTEQWRLITNLLDPVHFPAAELVDLYHRRWQAETTHFSIKATMLDGRVLRSRSIDGLDQEVYALLTAYQALIRAGDDALTGRPEVPMERISFTVLLSAATHRHRRPRNPPQHPHRPGRHDRPRHPGRPPARPPTATSEGPQPREPLNAPPSQS
ncbi:MULTISPECIES: transposase [unclassified Streptomyces]|uniref:transposase n=1 Tax=unclassified Streptomyces TaxID=2593676 RepID=UPI002255B237|nr:MULTISPECIES: transposase [unclassified Streptomyces]MCX5287079.1 transposase [Streptomyces sp. NBC_00183]